MPIPYINMALIEKPMNWAVIWSIALLWLLLFHVIASAIKGPGSKSDTGSGMSTPNSPAGPAPLDGGTYELHPDY